MIIAKGVYEVLGTADVTQLQRLVLQCKAYGIEPSELSVRPGNTSKPGRNARDLRQHAAVSEWGINIPDLVFHFGTDGVHARQFGAGLNAALRTLPLDNPTYAGVMNETKNDLGIPANPDRFVVKIDADNLGALMDKRMENADAFYAVVEAGIKSAGGVVAKAPENALVSQADGAAGRIAGTGEAIVLK